MDKIVTIGGFQYETRTKVNFYSESKRERILSRYKDKYMPVKYKLESAKNQKAGLGGKVRIPASEYSQILEQMNDDEEFQKEILDFHFKPVGNAPLLSVQLEDRIPTDEETAIITEANVFFWLSKPASEEKAPPSTPGTKERSRSRKGTRPVNTSTPKTRKNT